MKKIKTPPHIKHLLAKPKKLSREERLKKHKDILPQHTLQTFQMVKWLKRRFDENFLKKSIYMLLPNNGVPIQQEGHVPSRLELAKEFLQSHCKPHDNNKNTKIHPKYQ